MTHAIEPREGAVHGRFSSTLPAALTVGDGDTVTARTVDVTWGVEQHGEAGTPRRRYEPRDESRDAGPALVGPIAIEDAAPGECVEIEFIDFQPADWGWTIAGLGPFNRDLNDACGVSNEAWTVVRWAIDREQRTATNERGRTVSIDPFMGTVGLCPAGDGWHCGWTPRRTGGNMDCSFLTRGSRLFLPVECPGALLSLGDGHARQSDGECSGTAIECPMDSIEFRVRRHDSCLVDGPHAIRGDDFVTLGFGGSIELAMREALSRMLDAIESHLGLVREEAMALASVEVDLRITQVVNPVVGAHAVWRNAGIEL